MFNMFNIFNGRPAPSLVNPTDCNPIVSGEPFNFSAEHNALINKQVKRFNQALTALQHEDIKLALLSGISLGSWWLGGITISLLSCSFAKDYSYSRKEMFRQYQEVLADLIMVYQWVMDDRYHSLADKLAVQPIQELILILAPYISIKTLNLSSQAIKNATQEGGFLRGGKSKVPEAFALQLCSFVDNKSTGNWQFYLYGEEGMESLSGSVLKVFWEKTQNIAVQGLRPT